MWGEDVESGKSKFAIPEIGEVIGDDAFGGAGDGEFDQVVVRFIG